MARLILQVIQKIEVVIEAECFEKTTCRVNLRTNLGGTIHPRLDPVEEFAYIKDQLFNEPATKDQIDANREHQRKSPKAAGQFTRLGNVGRPDVPNLCTGGY